MGATYPGWDKAGPTGPGSVPHAELDKVGDSTDPRLLSLASCCSGRPFLDVELELLTARVATATGTAPMLNARASKYLAKDCLTRGSCGATGDWLEVGARSRCCSMYSAKLFGS